MHCQPLITDNLKHILISQHSHKTRHIHAHFFIYSQQFSMPFHPHRQYFIYQVLPMPHNIYHTSNLLRRCGCPCPWLSAPEIMENLLPQHFSLYTCGKVETNTNGILCISGDGSTKFMLYIKNGNTTSLEGIITCYLWKIYDSFVENNGRFLLNFFFLFFFYW